eukprot:scaffold282345_cov32-Tisochrysis_lutea.AAC.2
MSRTRCPGFTSSANAGSGDAPSKAYVWFSVRVWAASGVSCQGAMPTNWLPPPFPVSAPLWL